MKYSEVALLVFGERKPFLEVFVEAFLFPNSDFLTLPTSQLKNKKPMVYSQYIIQLFAVRLDDFWFSFFFNFFPLPFFISEKSIIFYLLRDFSFVKALMLISIHKVVTYIRQVYTADNY